MTTRGGWWSREIPRDDGTRPCLLLLGVNHRTAPLAVRERLAVSPRELPDALRWLRGNPGILEAALLSTCNRLELYVVTPDPERAVQDLISFLSFRSRLSEPRLRALVYRTADAGATRQLFRVVAGLDSMILGESEITAQAKVAYETARAAGTTGPVLNRLFQKSFRCAKLIRTSTTLARGQASIGSVVTTLARRLFDGQLADCEVLLWGAGKAAEATARHLVKAGIHRLWVVNRTQARAEELAQLCSGGWVSWERAREHLAHVDIAIVCTQAPHYVLDDSAAEPMRARRPGRRLCVIDLAVPRNVDPVVGRWPGVTLFNMDDLQAVMETTLAQRREALAACEEVLAAQVGRFTSWWNEFSVGGEGASCQAVERAVV